MTTGFAHLVRQRLPQAAARQDHTSMAATLDALEAVLTEENGIFEANQVVDHSRYIDKKNHILREFMIFQRTADETAVQAVSKRMVELRPLIQRNEDLLKAHIAAMNSIASALKTAMLDGDADGTYTKSEKRVSAQS